MQCEMHAGMSSIVGCAARMHMDMHMLTCAHRQVRELARANGVEDAISPNQPDEPMAELW
jgi:hypothetical protein